MEEGGQKRETSQERRKGRIEGESISVFLWGVTESQAARWMPVGVLSDWQSSWLFTLFFFFVGFTWTLHWHTALTQHRHPQTQSRIHPRLIARTHTQTCLKFTVSPAIVKAVYNGINMEMEVNASVAFSEQLTLERSPFGETWVNRLWWMWLSGLNGETERDRLVKKLNAEQVLPEGQEPISVTMALIIFSVH